MGGLWERLPDRVHLTGCTTKAVTSFLLPLPGPRPPPHLSLFILSSGEITIRFAEHQDPFVRRENRPASLPTASLFPAKLKAISSPVSNKRAASTGGFCVRVVR